MSSAPTTDRRRRLARRMMDEDETPNLSPSTSTSLLNSKDKSDSRAPPTPPSSSSRRRPTTQPSPSTSSPLPRSPRVLVTLAGRVYRPPDPLELRTKEEIEADLLLNPPAETVEDLARQRKEEKRKLIELEIKREKMRNAGLSSSPSNASGLNSIPFSPSQGKGRVLSFDSDDEEDEKLRVGGSPKKAHKTGPNTTPTKPARRSIRPVTPPPRPGSLGSAIPTSPSPSLGLPFGVEPSSSRSTALNTLPPSLSHLLSLHTALERALILHLSTHGSSIASTVSSVEPSSNTSIVRMTNLIDLPTLSRMMESSGKRFGENELKKLCWVWEGCQSDGGVSSASRVDNDADEEEKDRNEETKRVVDDLKIERDEAGGMGFLITRSRLSKSGKVSLTYGVGVSVTIKANPQLPKFQLVPDSPSSKSKSSQPTSSSSSMMDVPPSPSSIGKGRDGMSIVALWTQGKESRRREFETRLKDWSESEGGRRIVESEMSALGNQDVNGNDDLRWATSTVSHLLRNVPTAQLPRLDQAVPAIASTLTPSPKKPSTTAFDPTTPRSSSSGGGAGKAESFPIVSPKDFVKALMDGRPVKTKGASTTTADRARERRERIEAKQRANQPTAYQNSLSALSTGDSSPTKRSLKRSKEDSKNPAMLTAQEIFKQRAMLSRLGSIADVVAMRCGARPTRFDDVCTAITNSPLLSIGFDEADESLEYLALRFPDFCYIKLIGSTGNVSSSGSSGLGSAGRERWLVLTGQQKPRQVKDLVRVELERTAPTK